MGDCGKGDLGKGDFSEGDFGKGDFKKGDFKKGDAGKGDFKKGDSGQGELRTMLARSIDFEKGSGSSCGTGGDRGKDLETKQNPDKKIEHDRNWLFEAPTLFQAPLYDSPIEKQAAPIEKQTAPIEKQTAPIEKQTERWVTTMDELCPWMKALRRARRRWQELKMDRDKSPDTEIEISPDEEPLQTPPSKRTRTSRST